MAPDRGYVAAAEDVLIDDRPRVGVILQDAGLHIYDHFTGTHTKIVGTYNWNLNDLDEFCAAYGIASRRLTMFTSGVGPTV